MDLTSVNKAFVSDMDWVTYREDKDLLGLTQSKELFGSVMVD